MIRGFYKCTCKDCGHKFIGADVEYMCTAASAPVKCPKCGSLNTKMGILPAFVDSNLWELLKGMLSKS